MALAVGWSCRCVVHHNGGSIGDGLIPPPRGSLPLALGWSCRCGLEPPSRSRRAVCHVGIGPAIVVLPRRWAGCAIVGFATYALDCCPAVHQVSGGVGFILLLSGSPVPYGSHHVPRGIRHPCATCSLGLLHHPSFVTSSWCYWLRYCFLAEVFPSKSAHVPQ
jgi:hypothetical protein